MSIRLLLAAAGVALAAAAHAQDLTLMASPTANCLAVVPGAPPQPVYPPLMETWKLDATVRASLSFSSPDTPPALDLDLKRGIPEAFVAAVRAHAANLRLGCMDPKAGPVVLRQEYEFRHDNRKVAWSVPQDLADAERKKMLRCVSPMPGARATPEYPTAAVRREISGRVMLRLRFVAPDAPPQIQQFRHSWNRHLSDAAASWAEDLRMPCHQGGPVEAMWTFVFRLDGGDLRLSTLKDMPLTTFLGAVKGLDQLKARHDFNAMGCPFDVRLTYLRPHLPNEVGEVGEPRPGRADFLAWLSTLTLDLPDKAESQVLGSQATISVPCGRLQFE